MSLAEWCADVLGVELLPWQVATMEKFMPAPESAPIELHADGRGIPYALEPLDSAAYFEWAGIPTGSLTLGPFTLGPFALGPRSTFESREVPSWSDYAGMPRTN